MPQLLIVTYHAIGPETSAVCTSREQLTRDLGGLRDAGFGFFSLDAVADWIEGTAEIPGPGVVITFDDGYGSVVDEGLPVLQRMHVPAAVFVIAGRLGGDNQWEGQWTQVPRWPLVDAVAARDLAEAGITIGAHSWSHRPLRHLGTAEAHHEIVKSGDHLEQVLGQPVRHFAYPYGVRDAETVATAARRYRSAVHASPGVVDRRTPPCDVPRLDAHDLRVGLRLGLLGPEGVRPYLGVRRTLRRLRRQVERWVP